MKTRVFRIVLTGLLVVMSLSFAGAAYAEDDALPDPGITPDSPFYFFDSLGKRIGMVFTFGDEAKAARALRYAEERLAEARAMAGKNRLREMERAADGYNSYMAQVQLRLENQGASNNVCERVALAAARHLEVLDKIREEAPPQAGAVVERVRTASMDGQVNALRSLAEDRPERAIDIISDTVNRQIERVAVRLADNVTNARVTANVACALEYADRLAALQDEMAALAEEKGIDVTGLLQHLQQSTSNRLQTLNDVYENAPEEARAGIESAIENSVTRYEMSLEKLREQAGPIETTEVDGILQRTRAETTEQLQAAENIGTQSRVETREESGVEIAGEEAPATAGSPNRTG